MDGSLGRSQEQEENNKLVNRDTVELRNGHADEFPNRDTDELVRKFKDDYKEKGNGDLLYEVSYLSEFARRYQEKEDWPSLLRAHSLYNSCAVRDKENGDEWLEKAYHVQVDYWKTDIHSFSQHLQVTQTLKCELEEIRGRWRQQTERTVELFSSLNCEPNKLSCPENQELYTQILTDIPHLSISVNQDMIGFTRSVIERALAICGHPVCEYCVVALGSLARGEATPYSDLEFLFLLDLETMSEEVLRYFERFSLTIYFLIGNLGETKLKYMAIPELMFYNDVKKKSEHWFTDSAMNGFKIDGLGAKAGNIPTGNGSVEQQNHFICTVQELAERYKSVLDNPDPKKSLKGDLTAMLASTVYVSGDQRLHENLTSHISSYQPNEQRKTATVKMLESDTKSFDFRPDSDLTKTRDLKDDVYRYPSLLILDLKILHNIQSCDAWEIIQLLERRSVISSQTAECLKFSLCCAQIIRLSAYFYHNSQNEAISVLSCNTNENLCKGAWYLRTELLIHMFLHLVPLKEAVYEMASTDVTKTISTYMTTVTIYAAVALTRYHCYEYCRVLELLRAAYPDGLESADSSTQQMYINSAVRCKQYTEADQLLTKRIRSQRCDHTDFRLLGYFYRDQGYFPQALDSSMTRLAILISLHDFTDSTAVALAYSSIGLVLGYQSKYSEALVQYNRGLDMLIRIFGERDHECIARILVNIGQVLFNQSKYNEALVQHKRSLDMVTRIYGERDHVKIAGRIRNIGITLRKQSKYSEALVQHTRSLDMYTRIYGEKDHVYIAEIISSIGDVLLDQSKYSEALEHYNRCLDMLTRIFGGGDHISIANRIRSIGSVLTEQNKYSAALVHYKSSLQMYIRIFGDINHPDINLIRRNIRLVESLIQS